MSLLFSCYRMSFLLFLVQIACVSAPSHQSISDKEERAKTALPIKKYEQDAQLGQRLQALEPEAQDKFESVSRVNVTTGQNALAPELENQSKAVAPDNSEVQPRNDQWRLPSAIVLLIRTERWNKVLDETSVLLKPCSEKKLSFDMDCSSLAKARALALARLGFTKDVMAIYGDFASGRLNSVDAFFFAQLLADLGSPKLCAQLSRSGLQWEPSSGRLNLFVLQAKCLRLDGRLDEARVAVNVGLEEFRDHPHLLLESSLVFLSERNLTLGCQLLERLYREGFKDVAVFYNWGSCLIKRQDTETAKLVVARARSQWPSERLWLLLSGEVALLEGDFLQARRDGLDYLASSMRSDSFRAQAEVLVRNAQGEK